MCRIKQLNNYYHLEKLFQYFIKIETRACKPFGVDLK
jgi:hypothetical protein